MIQFPCYSKPIMSKIVYASFPGHIVSTYGLCLGVLEIMTILFLVLVRKAHIYLNISHNCLQFGQQ